MAYIKSDTEKDKILRNDSNKLQEQIQNKQKSLGLRGMVAKNNQDAYRQLQDIKNEQNHIRETMTQAKEKRLKRMKEQRQAKRKTYFEQLKLYLAKQERQQKDAYDSRRITYLDGGFSQYEQIIKMTPYRVLLKQINETEKNGIVIPDQHKDKMSKYKVICFGEGCEYVNENDIVLVEPYSGIEIVSKQDTYRIVYFDNIIIKIQE